MSKMSLKKNQAVVVARLGSTEKVLKFEVSGLSSDKVELNFEESGGVSIYSLEDWESRQAEQKAAKPRQGADRPRQQAPYMN
jgi:hypothetical protein